MRVFRFNQTMLASALAVVLLGACGSSNIDAASNGAAPQPSTDRRQQSSEVSPEPSSTVEEPEPVPNSEPGDDSGSEEVDLNECRSGYVALTFDDGPHPVHTLDLAEILDGLAVSAVFFVNGQHADQHPEILADMAARGHVMANHTYAHEDLTELSEEQILDTVQRTDDAVARAGAEMLPVVRPPWGLADERERSVLIGAGYEVVTWDWHVWDWEWPADQQVREFFELLDGPANNVLLHDGVVNSSETLAAVPEMVRGARERGYCFGVLDEAGEVVPTG